MIGRREVITLLGGAAAWPLAARAQQAGKVPTIGFFGATSASIQRIGNPVRAGFAVSLARPGGNMTGNSSLGPDLIGKCLEILKDFVPTLARVALLWNPDNDSNLAFLEELIVAVPGLGLQLISVPIRNADEFEGAFAAMMQRRPNALVTSGDPLLRRHMSKIVDFAAKNRLPDMYQAKEYVAAGGLMSYSANLSQLFRQGALYVHKILHGAKPADLPIEQPTRFELVVNLKTARALGLTVPPTLLARADDVIE